MTATLSPPSTTRAATVSTLSQVAGKAAHFALNIVSTLAILRYLAPDAYGSYVLVITVTTLVGVLADFGLPKLAVREISRSQHDADARLEDDPPLAEPRLDDTVQRAQDEILGTVVALRLGLALLAAGVAQLVLLVLGANPMVHTAALIAGLTLIVDAVLGAVVVVFQVHLVQQYEAIVRVGAEALETGLVLAFVAAGVPFLQLFLAPIVGLVVGCTLAVVLARRRFRLRLRPVRGRLRALLVEALPIGPALLISVLYLKLDSLVLAALRPARDLGIYGSAYQPIEYLFLGSATVLNVLFPMLARQWQPGVGASPRFLAVYRGGTELLFGAALLVPLLLAFVAPAVVELAFGPAYAAAAAPMRILALALVAMTLSAWQSLVLLAGGHQRVTLVYNAVALGVALGLCTVLVWRIGIIGAALSALATSLLVVIASSVAVRRRLGATLSSGPLLRILAAAAGTAALLLGLQALDAPWPLLLVLATGAYGLLLHGLGCTRSVKEALA